MLFELLSGGGEGSSQINDYVSNSVKSKANTCLICIETVKRADPVSEASSDCVRGSEEG